MPIEQMSGIMERLLDRAALALSLAGFEVSKKFIYTGRPPHDLCNQLSVHLDNANQTQTNPLGGLSGNRAVNRFAQLPAADLVVTWTACSPSFTAGSHEPSAEQYHEASKRAVDGIWAVYRRFSDEIRDNTLFTGMDFVPNNNRLGLVEPIGVSGGVAAYTLGVTLILA